MPRRLFEQGCALGFRPACANTSWVTHRRGEPERGAPVLSDLPVVLRGSKGKIVDSDPESLYVLACVRGFSDLWRGDYRVTVTASAPRG